MLQLSSAPFAIADAAPADTAGAGASAARRGDGFGSLMDALSDAAAGDAPQGGDAAGAVVPLVIPMPVPVLAIALGVSGSDGQEAPADEGSSHPPAGSGAARPGPGAARDWFTTATRPVGVDSPAAAPGKPAAVNADAPDLPAMDAPDLPAAEAVLRAATLPAKSLSDMVAAQSAAAVRPRHVEDVQTLVRAHLARTEFTLPPEAPAAASAAASTGARLTSPQAASTPARTIVMSAAPAAPPPAAAERPEDTTAQIVQAIRLQFARGGGEAQIRLEPRQFGDLTIALKVEHGQVVARLQADTPVVREWLQANQHLLRQALADQQLTLNRLDVSAPPQESRRGGGDAEPHAGARDEQGRPRRSPRPARGETFEVVA